MGQSKKQRKKYVRPKEPFDKERIDMEKKLIKEYGLKRKHEIQRAESLLRNFRRRARELQAFHDEKKEKELSDKLNTLGLIEKGAKLEDILGINLEDILSRRLQSILYKKSFANSVRHARQLIVHGHVRINKKKMLWPSYMVPARFENTIELSGSIKNKLIEGGDKR